MRPTRQQTLGWPGALEVEVGGRSRPEEISRAAAIGHPRASAPLAAWGRALRARLDYMAIRAWIDRGRQRRALGELDDRLLEDIGLSRADARRESAKPFWRP